MSFMISRETDNVRSIAEVEGAFRAITARGEKPYVTREDLLQVIPPNCCLLRVFDWCLLTLIYTGTASRAGRVLY